MKNEAVLAVLGKRNWQVRGCVHEPTLDQLARWAKVTSNPKYADRQIAVFRVGSRNRKLEVLYKWHVGEGFEHAEGWWVAAEGE